MPPTRPLGNQSIVRRRAPLTANSRDGSLERDWANAVETTITQCNVQPFKLAEKLNFEDNREREFTRSALRVYAPAGTDVDPDDIIVYRGKQYDVFGFSGEWFDFDAVAHHVAFIIRLREG